MISKNVEYITKDRIDNFAYINNHWTFKDKTVNFETITKETGITPSDWSDFYKLIVNTNIQKIWKHKVQIENKTYSYIEFNVWDSSNPPYTGPELKSIVFSSNLIPGQLKENTIVEPIKLWELNSDRDILRVCSNIENNWFIMFYRYGTIGPSFYKQVHLK